MLVELAFLPVSAAFTDCVSGKDNEIGCVRSVFWTNRHLTSIFACAWVMTIVRQGLKIKAIGQCQGVKSQNSKKNNFEGVDMRFLAKCVVIVGFHCDIISCDLARQGVRRGEAACGCPGGKRGQWRLTRSVWRRSYIDASILVWCSDSA